jgi:non-ribosomal peptide synthetase component E (peptide arylation enzyme)
MVPEWGSRQQRRGDGYLYVRGRLKEIINRGGEKISPGDIEAVLLSNPKVLEAESSGESDAIYGENVQAAVILRPGMETTDGELRDYCRTKLSAFEVPERIHIVSDFPRTAKGSTDRRALALQFVVGDSQFVGSRRDLPAFFKSPTKEATSVIALEKHAASASSINKVTTGV